MRPHHVRQLIVGVALAGVAVSAGGLSGAGATVAPPESFQASAAASGVRIGMAVPGFAAVEQVVDAGAPIAQAAISGLGTSTAMAAAPFPGDLALTGPGTVAALSGLPSAPPYPLVVTSSHPTAPEAKTSAPGLNLVATSSAYRSAAQATSGSSNEQARAAATAGAAEAAWDPDAGQALARATSDATALSVGGVLAIASVQSHAHVIRSPGGDAKSESGLVVSGATVAGQAVEITPKGLQLPGSETPLPDSSPLMQALKQAQIHVQYLTARPDADGITSEGLEITHVVQFPDGPAMVLTYVVGQTVAHAVVGPAPALPPVLDSGPAANVAPAPAVDQAPGVVANEAAPVPAAVPASPAKRASARPFIPELGASVGSDVAPTTTEAAAPSAIVRERAQPRLVVTTQPSATSAYTLLVVAALVALVSSQIIRIVGVKSR